tara:strand:- start:9747 stop:10130 length:384 start_codon:yes stop_codon:yes gene_type:complete
VPVYVYKHPDKELYEEVVQGMKEEHIYIDDEGVKWDRVFLNPQAIVKDNIDPFNKNQFLEKTSKQKGNMGDLIDQSRELSEKREKSLGKDPVKEKFFDNYAKERKGKRHWDDPKRQSPTKNKNFTID